MNGKQKKKLTFQSDDSKEQFSMFLIIPNEITGLKNVEANLEKVQWDESIKAGLAKKLHIDMPKFKVESTIDVKPILQKVDFYTRFNFSIFFHIFPAVIFMLRLLCFRWE